MEKQSIEKSVDTKDGSAVYEVSYLLLPSLAQEQVPAKATVLKDMLTRVGGEIISDENPVLIDLAYSMTKIAGVTRHKVTTGYFGWVKFEISREAMEAVKKNLDSNDEVVRYLIIRTVRENTLLNGKMKLQKEERVRREDKIEDTESVLAESEGEIKESMPEEIDKSIDDLVIV